LDAEIDPSLLKRVSVKNQRPVFWRSRHHHKGKLIDSFAHWYYDYLLINITNYSNPED